MLLTGPGQGQLAHSKIYINLNQIKSNQTALLLSIVKSYNEVIKNTLKKVLLNRCN